MATIQDILMAKAAEDAAEVPTAQNTLILSGGLGAGIGAAMGQQAHQVGQGLNELFGRTPNRFKAGPRMAGGLVGAILGGALGMGARQMMIDDSPAARLLAKSQVQGELNPMEMKQLQNILTEVYSEMGLRA